MCTDTDPRLSGEFCRRPPAGNLTLVGVVHDHPASVHRVRRLLDRDDPDTLALELPPLAVPLFRTYAENGGEPPSFGGEMSAAIQAAGTDRVVGIDGPTLGFAGRLASRLVTGDHSPSTASEVVRSLACVTGHACVCRLAAVAHRWADVSIQVDEPVDHGCSLTDDPAEQAADERSQIRRARTVMNTFGPRPASALRKRTRENYMADKLTTLAEDRSVVAVVGAGHLDELAERLE